jgi:hypothetical protein
MPREHAQDWRSYMAKKLAADRLEEIWQYIDASATQRSNLEAEMKQHSQSADAIAAALSLGWWVLGGDAEKKRRQAVRASSFLDIVNLNVQPKRYNDILTNNNARTQTLLDQNIQTILRNYSREAKSVAIQTRFVPLVTTKPEFMKSMLDAGSHRRELAARSLGQASAMITRAWPYVVRAKTPATPQRRYYEEWFGEYSDTRYAQFKKTFTEMHGVLANNKICLHLRTSETVKKKMLDDTPGAPPGTKIAETIATPNGTYKLSDLFAWAIPKGTDGLPHVFLCDVFYTTNGRGPHEGRKSGEVEDWSDNIGGVLIHELSHSLSGTADHINPTFGQPSYGRVICGDLALRYPDLAVTNADNFEIFCEDIAKI